MLLDDSSNGTVAIHLEAFPDALLQTMDVRILRRQVFCHVETNAFVGAGWQALLRSGGAGALERGFIIRFRLVVTDGDVKTLLDVAVGPAPAGLAIVLRGSAH